MCGRDGNILELKDEANDVSSAVYHCSPRHYLLLAMVQMSHWKDPQLCSLRSRMLEVRSLA